MAEQLRDIHPLREILGKRPLGLFSDIDGTLAPIVDRPEDARVSPRCREVLAQLIADGVIVSLITGRTPEMAQRMTDVAGVIYGANHGMTLVVEGREEVSARVREYMARAKEVYAQTSNIGVEGVFVEVTGPNLAYHYRIAENEEESRAAILAAIAASHAAQGFQVREGRKVIELQPNLPLDKGTALTELARRLKVKGILCLGDDATDIDMFRAAGVLRDDGLEATTVAVWSDEVAAEVMENADYFVEGVPGVEWVLGEVLSELLPRGS